MAKVHPVVTTANVSATGSARKTAMACSAPCRKNRGRMKIKGINRMIFRKTAKNRDTFALPNAIKVCWQAICAPKMSEAAI